MCDTVNSELVVRQLQCFADLITLCKPLIPRKAIFDLISVFCTARYSTGTLSEV